MVTIIEMNQPSPEAIKEFNRLIDKYLLIQYKKMTEEEKQECVNVSTNVNNDNIIRVCKKNNLQINKKYSSRKKVS